MVWTSWHDGENGGLSPFCHGENRAFLLVANREEIRDPNPWTFNLRNNRRASNQHHSLQHYCCHLSLTFHPIMVMPPSECHTVKYIIHGVVSNTTENKTINFTIEYTMIYLYTDNLFQICKRPIKLLINGSCNPTIRCINLSRRHVKYTIVLCVNKRSRARATGISSNHLSEDVYLCISVYCTEMHYLDTHHTSDIAGSDGWYCQNITQ